MSDSIDVCKYTSFMPMMCADCKKKYDDSTEKSKVVAWCWCQSYRNRDSVKCVKIQSKLDALQLPTSILSGVQRN